MEVRSGTPSGVLSSIDFCRLFYVSIGKPSGFLSLCFVPTLFNSFVLTQETPAALVSELSE